MDQSSLTTSEQATRQDRINRLRDDYGLGIGEAEFAVDLADGKTHGDIVGLSDEQRVEWGLGRPMTDERTLPAPVPAGAPTH